MLSLLVLLMNAITAASKSCHGYLASSLRILYIYIYIYIYHYCIRRKVSDNIFDPSSATLAIFCHQFYSVNCFCIMVPIELFAKALTP
jgi:hypothetical protein